MKISVTPGFIVFILFFLFCGAAVTRCGWEQGARLKPVHETYGVRP